MTANQQIAANVKSTLAAAGIPAMDALKLGVYVHLTFRCRETAERAASLMTASTFKLCKIFDSVEYVKATKDTGSPKTYPVVRAVFTI